MKKHFFLHSNIFYINLQSQNGKYTANGNWRVVRLIREHSSVGLEHLPYKQRVIGSTPITPTRKRKPCRLLQFTRFFIIINLFFYEFFFLFVSIATTFYPTIFLDIFINSPNHLCFHKKQT